MKKAILPLLAAALLAVLSACLPSAGGPQPPQARVQSFQLLSVDPFSGEASFAMQLKVSNPNSFELPLLDSTMTLYFGDAQIPFELPQMTIPPAGFEVVPTRINVPLAQTAGSISKLLRGDEVRLRITGKAAAKLGPVPLQLGPFTLLDETVRVNLSFAMPRFEIDAANSSLALSGARLRITVAFRVTNPNPIGFTLRGPVALLIGGREVGSAVLDAALRPQQTSPGQLVFSVNVTEVPGAAAALLSGLQVEVRGGVNAEIPGIWRQALDLLLSGRVR